MGVSSFIHSQIIKWNGCKEFKQRVRVLYLGAMLFWRTCKNWTGYPLYKIIERRDLALLKITHKALYDDTWPEYLRLKFHTVSAYNLRSLEAPKLAIPSSSSSSSSSSLLLLYEFYYRVFNSLSLFHQWKRRDLLCYHNDGDLFTCEDNMLFSRFSRIGRYKVFARKFTWCFTDVDVIKRGIL